MFNQERAGVLEVTLCYGFLCCVTELGDKYKPA
ncbi:hypothetical protein IMSAGC002_00269 [Lachnospiraceae bacterium]|nr:hypothetical protein IMSAGC002_00269 [Lachnospiraceae bacterium]